MGQFFGRYLIVAGAVILLIGIILATVGRIPFVGRLPGDILIKRDNLTFYFPLTTCIVISLILTLLSRFFGHK